MKHFMRHLMKHFSIVTRSKKSKKNQSFLVSLVSLSLLLSVSGPLSAEEGGLFGNLFGGEKSGAEAAQGIQDDVSRIYSAKGTELAKKLQTGVRTLVEKLMMNGINASLYLQGIEPAKEGEPVDPNLILVTDHFTRYCSQGENNISSNCSADLLMQDADIKLSSVLSGSRLDAQQAEAARRFTMNTVDPRPDAKFQGGKTSDGKAITLERISSDAALRKDLADSLIAQALLSIPRNSFSEMIAKRSDIISNDGQPVSDQTFMELMEQQACQRFFNQDWQSNMKAAYLKAMATCGDPPVAGCNPMAMAGMKPEPEKAVLFELAIMNATRTCLEFESYKQQERVEALLAAQVAQTYHNARAAAGLIAGARPNLEALSTGEGAEAGGAAIPSGGTGGGTTGGGATGTQGGATGTQGGTSGGTTGTTGIRSGTGSIRTPSTQTPVPGQGGTTRTNTQEQKPEQ